MLYHGNKAIISYLSFPHYVLQKFENNQPVITVILKAYLTCIPVWKVFIWEDFILVQEILQFPHTPTL